MAKFVLNTIAAVICVLLGHTCAQTTELVTVVSDCGEGRCSRDYFEDDALNVVPDEPCYDAGKSVFLNCTEGGIDGATTNECGSDGAWSKLAATCLDQSLENNITLFCEPGYYYIKVPGALLGDYPADKTRVRLGTDAEYCEGYYYDGEYMIVNSSYTDCETTIETDHAENNLVYRNTLKNFDPEQVTTMKYFEVAVTCVFDQNNRVSSTAIINIPIHRDLDGIAKYDIPFRVFTDSSYSPESEVTTDTIVDTNTYIYLLAEVNDVQEVDLFPTNCYATPNLDSNYNISEDLIVAGCEDSNLVTGLTQDASGIDNPNFAFTATVFRFTEDSLDQIYIHCDLKVCPDPECPLPNNCTEPTRRRRRSTDIAFSRHISTGPIRMARDEPAGRTAVAGSVWQMTALTVYSALLSTVILSAAVLVIATRYRRGKTTIDV